jgi:hypothetical protein
MAKLIAGLTWAPLMAPIKRIIIINVLPMTKALPPDARTLKTSKKVPRNSAIKGRKETISRISPLILYIQPKL